MAGKRKYSCNYRYFKNIDTPEKAYWLGMLMADGCIMHTHYLRHLKTCDSWQDRYYLQLSLKEDDLHHIQKFKKAIESSHPINTYSYSSGTADKGKYSRLVIEDKALVGDLISHGVCENKTLILKYPDIPEEFDSHFIRGYFDGDGCISMSKSQNQNPMYEANITSTYEFLKSVYQRLLQVLNYLYQDSTNEIRLDRKYEKYKELQNLMVVLHGNM